MSEGGTGIGRDDDATSTPAIAGALGPVRVSHERVIVFSLDPAGHFTLHEGALRDRLGHRLGQSAVAEFSSLSGAMTAIRDALAGSPVHWKGSRDGITWDVHLQPELDRHGQVRCVHGVAVDVSDFERAEEQRRRNDARVEAILERSSEVIIFVDETGTRLYTSPSVHRVLGFSPLELNGGRVLDHVVEADRATAHATFEKVRTTPGVAFPFAGRFLHRDGSLRWLEGTLLNLLADPEIGAMVAHFRDVTAEREADRVRRENRFFLEQAWAVANVGSWMVTLGPEPRVILSDETCRLLGLPAGTEMSLDEGVKRLVHPEDRDRVEAGLNASIAEGRPFELEYRVFRNDGATVWLSTRGQLQRREDGGEARIVAVSHDITKQREAAEALRASELRYRRIVESTSDGVLTTDADGVVNFANQRFAEMLGTSLDEIIGQPVVLTVREDHRDAALAQMHAHQRGTPSVYEVPLATRDGLERWALVRASRVRDASGAYAGSIALASDVSDRRRADEMRQRLAAIVESAHDAIVSKSLDGIVETWNAGAEQLFGYGEKEMVGRSVRAIIPEDRVAEELQLRADVVAGRRVERIETMRRRKDGSLVPVALLVSPLRDANGRIVGVTTIARDLTAQRQAQAALERSEEQLRQAQKMEAVGRLAGGVAHDFNNILTVIISYASTLTRGLASDDPVRADLEEIRRAGERAATLTKQLLAFSRRQLLKPQVLDLPNTLHALEPMLRRLLGEDVQLTVSAWRCGYVSSDPGQLEQVIVNLAANARDAMPRGGRLTLDVRDLTVEGEEAAGKHGVPPGKWVVLSATDTGMGMERAVQERIFEPFFTTKEQGKGTGLGLAMVHGFVVQSGGHVRVESAPGAGSTFRIYLPRTEGAPQAESAEAAAQARLTGTETILLVEDDEQVRQAIRASLRAHGYRVLEAANAGEALLECEQHEAPIHLLLSDVVMPRMTGGQLAERLATVRPAMKVLFVSGYATDAHGLRAGLALPGSELLPKPFTPDALLQKVRSMLDAPRPTTGT